MSFTSRTAATAACILAILLAFCRPAAGQQNTGRISGTVLEESTSEAVIQAAVMLLSPADSTLIRGVVTDGTGRFSIHAPAGSYIVKFSLLGYADKCIDIQHTPSKEGLDMGKVTLEQETIFLASSVVTARAQMITVVEDTVSYNTAAFNLPEDAMLEDLLKKIPGLEVNGGTVTLQGRPISEIYVNGERFFSGNVKAGLKSITADMIDKINAYERESDLARITGVDDGEQVPVLDLKIKKNMLDKWKAQLNMGGGTESRYTGRMSANRISKDKQVTVVLSQRNTASLAGVSLTSRNQLGTGSAGDRTAREAGVTFSRKKPTLTLNGNMHYDGTLRTAEGNNRTENISASSVSYTNSLSDISSCSNVVKADMTLEWRPDKNNTFYVKPVFTYTGSGSRTTSRSSYFKGNPYLKVDDPSQWIGGDIQDDPLKELRSNFNSSLSHSYSDKFVPEVSATYTHRFSKKGRSLSFNTKDSFTAIDEDQFNRYRTRYYKIARNPDSTLIRGMYVDTDTRYINLAGQLTYSEPIAKGLYLQTTLRTNREIRLNDKSHYRISDSRPGWAPTEERGFSGAKASLPSGWEQTRREDLSSQGRYDFTGLSLVLNLRFTRKKFNMTAGGTLRPQHTTLSREGSEDVTKRFFRVAPNISLRYKPTSHKQLAFNYSNWAVLPSMYQLMPVNSGTNPLYVHIGNPDLKAGLVHSMTASYNSSNIKKQSSLIFSGSARITRDMICTITSYDQDSGVRTTTQGNIDGNWQMTSSLVFNKTFQDTRFSISNHTGAEYHNDVAYLYNSGKKVDEVNHARRLMAKERLDLNFRTRWIETELNLKGEYTAERSNLRPEINGDICNVSAGITTDVIFPWKMRLSTDFSYMVQRGYAYSELNRDYMIWNASLSQPFLKGRMTLRAEATDILGQLPNLTRTFGSQTRGVNFYNGYTQYVLLRLIFRLGKK